MADFNPLKMSKRTSQSPKVKPFEMDEEGEQLLQQYSFLNKNSARISSDEQSVLPTNLRQSLRDLLNEQKKQSARSSYS